MPYQRLVERTALRWGVCIDHHGEGSLCSNEALALAGVSSQVGTSRPVRECRDVQQACKGVTQPPSSTGLALAAAGAAQGYCSVEQALPG